MTFATCLISKAIPVSIALQACFIHKKFNIFCNFHSLIYCEFILGFAQEGAAEEPIKCDGPCDPCVCREIPGLVYNAEINGCAWPDEVGCALSGKLNFFFKSYIIGFPKISKI